MSKAINIEKEERRLLKTLYFLVRKDSFNLSIFYTIDDFCKIDKGYNKYREQCHEKNCFSKLLQVVFDRLYNKDNRLISYDTCGYPCHVKLTVKGLEEAKTIIKNKWWKKPFSKFGSILTSIITSAIASNIKLGHVKPIIMRLLKNFHHFI